MGLGLELGLGLAFRLALEAAGCAPASGARPVSAMQRSRKSAYPQGGVRGVCKGVYARESARCMQGCVRGVRGERGVNGC